MREYIKVDQMNPEASVVSLAVEVARQGGVLIMPTDSVYGIGVAATPQNPGHKRVFEIKQRPSTQTLPWLVGSKSDLQKYAHITHDWAYKLVDAYWPGALTLVVTASENVPDEYVLPDNRTIALRMPNSPLVCQIAQQLGCPLATTSANTHGAPSAVDGCGLEDCLIEQADLTLDGGPAPLAIASTIVDCTGDEPRILREGALSTKDILATAGFAGR